MSALLRTSHNSVGLPEKRTSHNSVGLAEEKWISLTFI